MNEWKKIDGFNARYSISTDGTVRNDERGTTVKPMLSTSGYHYVHLVVNRKSTPCMCIDLLVMLSSKILMNTLKLTTLTDARLIIIYLTLDGLVLVKIVGIWFRTKSRSSEAFRLSKTH